MATAPHLDPPAIAELVERLRVNLASAVKAPDAVLREVLVALLAEGHVLIEDNPGVGKTALARALARSVDAEFARVQCTADLLPADVVGTSVFNQRESRFEFRPGPVFANVVLVDEINRASPKTQSGLLECMQERHVTVDNTTHDLARPFVVLATQNPIEYEGTYPLPEAQLDRFMVRVSLGYPSVSEESDMLATHGDHDRVLDVEPVTDVAEIRAAQVAVARVHGSEALRRYIVQLLDATRADPRVELGASPRAGLMLFRAAKALAVLDRRDHVLPDDVQALAKSVLTHRLLLSPEAAGQDRATVVADALERVSALGAPRDARAAPSGMSRALGALLLGAALVLAAHGVRHRLAVRARRGAAAGLGRRAGVGRAWPRAGAGIDTEPGPPTVEERRPYPLRLTVHTGLLPAPGGELETELLEEPISLAGMSARRLRIDVQFERRGRRVIEPPSFTIHDPLRLVTRTVRDRRRRRRAAGAAADRAGGHARRLRRRRGRQPRATARARPPRCAARRRARPPSWTWTGCAPTAPAPRPRASTGPRWRAAARCWSGA